MIIAVSIARHYKPIPVNEWYLITLFRQAKEAKLPLKIFCRMCNEFKGSHTTGMDPLTGQIMPLFNPRQQNWIDHFAWEDSGIRIIGLTAVGRATVVTLQMNHEVIVPARRK